MSITLSALQKQRTDTAANWTAENPTLLAGELGFESDTGKAKLGTGSTAWNSLGYLGLIPSSGIYPLSQLLMPSGTAGAPSLSFDDDTDTGLYRTGANAVAISTNGTGRLFVDSSGNVGVGSTSTNGNLTFSSSASVICTDTSDGSDNKRLVLNGGGGGFSNGRGGYIVLSGNEATNPGNVQISMGNVSGTGIVFNKANGTPCLNIDSDGKVGLGTSTPTASALLDVNGNARIGSAGNFDTDTRLLLASTGGNCYLQIQGADTTGTAGIKFGRNSVANRAGIDWSASTDKLTIRTGGTSAAITVDNSQRVGIGTTSPLSRCVISNSGANGFEFDPAASSGTVAYVATYNRSTSAYTDLQFDTASVRFTNGGAERARIDSSGRLLVGTSSSPSAGDGQYAKLVVQGYAGGTPGGGVVSIQRDEAATSITDGETLGFIGFNDSAGNTFASIQAAGDGTAGSGDYPGRLVFSTTAATESSPTERMRITSGGTLIVNGGGTVDTGVVFGVQAADSQDAAEIKVRTNGKNAFKFRNSTNVEVGSITINTSATAYNTSSDYRLKENITAVTDGITRLQQLKPSRFNFIADPSTVVDGFLAHEVQTIVPEAITGEKDAVDDEGNPEYQGIDQSKLVPLLTAALQEAVAKIESLEARLTAAGI